MVFDSFYNDILCFSTRPRCSAKVDVRYGIIAGQVTTGGATTSSVITDSGSIEVYGDIITTHR